MSWNNSIELQQSYRQSINSPQLSGYLDKGELDKLLGSYFCLSFCNESPLKGSWTEAMCSLFKKKYTQKKKHKINKDLAWLENEHETNSPTAVTQTNLNKRLWEHEGYYTSRLITKQDKPKSS